MRLTFLIFGSCWSELNELFPGWFTAKCFGGLCISLRSSCQEVFCKKGVLKNFTKLIRKHLCQSLFFNKVAGLKLLFLQFLFKTLSSRNLDPKPRKCVFKFKVWWRRKPSLSIVWRQNAINFDWKCWFTSFSLKIIVKKRFHNWFWAQRKKKSF